MAAHLYWRLVGVTAVAGHTANGFGICAFNFKDAGGTSLLSGTGGLFASSTDGTWSLAQSINGSTAANNGWYSGNAGFTGAYIGYHFPAPVLPVTFTLASLTGFSWTIGTQIKLQFSDDNITWTDQRVYNVAGADNVIQSFTVAAPPAANAQAMQLAYAVPTKANGGELEVSQIAYVSLGFENPPPAGGGYVSQLAIVSLGVEYPVPVIISPLSIAGFMQTMPYYIGEFT